MADTDELYAKAKSTDALKTLALAAAVPIAAPAIFALASAVLNGGLYGPLATFLSAL